MEGFPKTSEKKIYSLFVQNQSFKNEISTYLLFINFNYLQIQRNYVL